jgi:hypothetical protein
VARACLILAGDSMREKAINWVRGAPAGTRLEFREPKRTLPQNDRMWAMLTDVANQVEHCGRRYDTNEWKCLFMHALGREIQFIPSLDEKTFLPLGLSSSDLSKTEMSELIEFIHAWGAEHNVTFHDHTEAA